MQNTQTAAPETYFRARHLIEKKIVPFSAPTLWRLVAAGRFPQPVRPSPGVTAWRASDVLAWQAKQGGVAS